MRIRRVVKAIGSCALLLLSVPAWGATLCVSATGAAGCATHINDAITAAAAGDVINVGPGIYAERVIITKPLSLVGNGATINAAGQLEGIFVNGMASPPLGFVHVSGFTVMNANLEGILVLNASNVTISGNTVMNNDRALVNGNCTMPQDVEPGEAGDCGEGIHLQAVDHSVVSNNTVTGNSGGILLTDDTGANHDNLVSFNTTADNPYACGIVLASHVQPTYFVSQVPPGVYHNTVYGNRSLRNGLIISGAGIGVFASIPGAKAYGNVIVNNLVSQNGLPGIALHAHVPGQVMTDNMIVGNTAVGNGADTDDAFTPGPTGINLYSAGPETGNIISGNSIQGEAIDVAIKNPAPVQVQFNGLLGLGMGVLNQGVGVVDASSNWWSCPSGPGASILFSCSRAVGTGVMVSPWLTVPIPAQPSY